MRPSVCLNMIVKNEAHVVARCLEALRPFITHWVVVDTGSTDGTQEIVRKALESVPGELHERPWRDFGTNRSEAMALARGKADYVLVFDADDILRVPEGWQWPALTADAYDLTSRRGGTAFGARLLVADRKRWKYVGVLHEYIECGEKYESAVLPGIWVDRPREGARSLDPDTYRKDALILEAAFLEEPANARYAFYLAQSWRDAGDQAKALAAYRRRVEMKGWEEEVWYSLYQVARLQETLGAPAAEVRSAYLDAHQYRPSRAEPLNELARYHRERGEWHLAHLFARRAASTPIPADTLFVDEAVYQWRALDELGTSAYWAGALDEGRDAMRRLLGEGRAPLAERPRLERNMAFYPIHA